MLKFIFTLFTAFLIFDSSCYQEVFAQRSKQNFSLSPFIKLNSFGWSEFGDSGNELLNESGFMFSFGSSADYYFTKKKNLFINSEIHFYLGKVNYDGFLFDALGNQEPYSNKIDSVNMHVDSGFMIRKA